MGGLPAWEGGHPGRHAGWKPALLKEERDALHSIVIGASPKESPMTIDRIEMNPAVMLGKPVIRGTRIPVEVLLRKLGEGATEADLLEAYPRLVREDVQAALSYVQGDD